jgi:hypothetical protein
MMDDESSSNGDSDNHFPEEIYAGQQQQYPMNARVEAERQFYVRFARFLVVLMIFFGIMFISEMEHDNFLFLAGIAGLGIWMLYMIGSLSYTLMVVNPRNNLREILTEEELGDIDNQGNEEQDGENAIDGGVGRMAVFSFDETPNYVRSCRQEIGYLASKPKNGRYKVVYNAVYFGKSIRSESNLYLQFDATMFGWEVSGMIYSGKDINHGSCRHISEGFLNGRCELYWKLDKTHDEAQLDGLYRGLFDLPSCTMFDGDFKAGTAPPGRIVRMELMEETSVPPQQSKIKDDWGSTGIDVEMVALGNSII